ncbi:FliM/FliN family flagellar motor switch protein [Novosphingobium mangrovi (ex Huang et al. 2023)]|uniref:FliM/FliN family flagellar motor switch protein n=1 Tax=Novosphingobium mangrovi (ex Huang et al. 2023) TaxID=2976432 RepID=A0ABT2I048_9SPHN|nr:FliM/FliN family flagellar motor switch protein [Novosphingobium mangrovi (ex Huang et al. 2023)]MCT2398176.1 FliM/FliN family flagellar motor switch protein [Novosphingobium mangrovi (ex Huang et al. 2023)]
MNMQSAHFGQSTRAKHCAELLGTEPTIDELVPALSLLGERLARVLPGRLSQFSGGEAPLVRIGMPMDCTLGSIQAEIENLASHTLLTIGPENLPMLATFEAAPVLRLIDRAFGGLGVAPEPLPESFPLSAELLLKRLEGALADALTEALGGGEQHKVGAVRRDTSLRYLNPFDRRQDLLQLSLEVEEPGIEPWSFSIAFPQPTLGAVMAAPRHPVRQRAHRTPSDPVSEPFGSMPVPVTAVLVDMTIGFSRLSSLKPGDVLPVAVARSVPLQVDGRTIATGTIGEVEDRVAVQILQAF